jgi:hypothetical protein
MQRRSISQAATAFPVASSLFEVRGAFKATKLGNRYIFLPYVTNVVLISLAILAARPSVLAMIYAYLGGYFLRAR